MTIFSCRGAARLRQCLVVAGLFCWMAANVPPGQAAQAFVFKVGSLAPKGSVWATKFQDFVDDVRLESNGAIDFKIYPSGIMGDDRAMLRKMRVGQLHGGGFTMSGISAVVPDFSVMSLPFLFQTHEEVDRVRAEIMPDLREAFARKGFVLYAVSEVGFVYTMSVAPVATMDALRASKLWVPPEDTLSRMFLKNLGITPTPLAIPDVLPSLQTGLVDVVFNSFYGSLVLQWFTKTLFYTDVPFGYAYTAFILDAAKVKLLPPDSQQLMQRLADKHFPQLDETTRASNRKALDALLANGMKRVVPQPEALAEMSAVRDRTVAQSGDSFFASSLYGKVVSTLAASRKTHQK